MKSTASIKGHPIHPIFVGFPIAFFAGAVLSDAIHLIAKRKDNFFPRTAMYFNALGVLSGLAAAVPGVIDYFGTVPPKSSAKDRATKHGLLNVGVVTIFSVACEMHRRNKDNGAILCLETAGLVMLGFSGWMGGTLVYRNQIGVYNRYANAGKWNEEWPLLEDGQALAAKTDELKEGKMKLLHIKGKRIVLAKTGNKYAAFDDHCTHKGGSLAGGVCINGIVQCPWHGSEFDCLTGEVHAGPATKGIKTYTVMVEGAQVWVEVG